LLFKATNMNLFVKVIVRQKAETRKPGNVHPNDVVYLSITSISYLRNSAGGKIDVGFPDYELTTTKEDLGMDNPLLVYSVKTHYFHSIMTHSCIL
jgi:hypothetical protein